MGLTERSLKCGPVVRRHAESAQIQSQGLLFENAQHDALAVHRGHRRDAQVDQPAVEREPGAAILRQAFLRDAQVRHDLQAGYHGAQQGGRRLVCHPQHAIDQVADAKLACQRFKMDIRRPLADGVANNVFDQLDHRRRVLTRLLIGRVAPIPPHKGRSLIVLSDGRANIAGRCDHGLHGQPGLMTEPVDGFIIERVADGHLQCRTQSGHWKHRAIFRQIPGQRRQRRRVRRQRREIHKGKAAFRGQQTRQEPRIEHPVHGKPLQQLGRRQVRPEVFFQPVGAQQPFG